MSKYHSGSLHTACHQLFRWVAGALDVMQQSSQKAASILISHGCTSCTDVTGFGLLGHMVEMAQASKVGRVHCTFPFNK